jgi:hypothetical protein
METRNAGLILNLRLFMVYCLGPLVNFRLTHQMCALVFIYFMIGIRNCL